MTIRKSRRVAFSLCVVALLLGSALFAIMVLPVPAKATTVCTITYSGGSPPPQQLTIGSPGIYCFASGTYDTQITVTASNVVLTGVPGTPASEVIIQPTILTDNAVNYHCLIETLCSNNESVVDRNPATIPAIIYVAGATSVAVEGLTVDGSMAASTLSALQPVGCIPSNGCYMGIYFYGASGTIAGSAVTNINTYAEYLSNPSSPPYGNGILVANGTTGISTVTISGNAIATYAKNGITCVFQGTTCKISNNQVSPLILSEEKLSSTASNGIEIGRGATGTISGNVVSGNVCVVGADCGGSVGSDLILGAQATGIVTYLASGAVPISGNTLTGNDIGIELVGDTGMVTSTSNAISSSTYVGLAVFDESQWVSNNKFTSEPVGIEAASDTPGLTATATVSCNTFSSVTTQTTMENVAGANARIVVGSSYCGVLSTPTLSPSNPAIDSGQSITLTAMWAGGTSTYTVTLYSSPTSFCYSRSTPVQTKSGVPGISTTFTVSPTANTYYCAIVTDSSTVPATMLSGVALVNVNWSPVPALLLSQQAVDTGQSLTLTATVTWGVGGISPYTVTLYSGTSSSCASDTTEVAVISGSNPQTGVTGSPAVFAFKAPGSNTYYCATVTDSASTPATESTSTVPFTVNSALGTVTLVISPTAIDSGQSPTVTATVVWSGGSSPYTVTLYSGSSSTCSSDTVIVAVSGTNPQVVSTGTTATLTLASTPRSSTYYCATVTDAALLTASSATTLFTINAALSVTLVLSPSVFDSGQSAAVTATVTWVGGISPYTVFLYGSTTAVCSTSNLVAVTSISNPLTGVTGGTGTFTLSSPASTTYYCAKVTDSSKPTPATIPSPISKLTVNRLFTAPSISVVLPAIDAGQSSTLSATAPLGGGTSPYTCQWLVEGSGASVYSNLGASFSCTASSTPTASTGTLSTLGAWNYELQLKDSSSTPITVTSAPVTVTVNPDPSVTTLVISPATIDSGQSPTVAATVVWSGGSSPYIATLYSGSSSTCSSDNMKVALLPSSPQSGANPQTGLTGSSAHFTFTAPGSTEFYCVKLTDAASWSVLSSTATFTVNLPPSAVTLVLSPSVFDSGQSAAVTATVTWVGGVSPYTVTLYSGSSSSCASDTTMVGVLTGVTLKTGALVLTSPASTTYYCAVVTDGSAPTPATSPSSAVELTVNPLMTALVISVAPSAIDAGQSSTLSATAPLGGGTSPYTCQWLQEAPGVSAFSDLGASLPCTTASSPIASTGTLYIAGAWRFELQVTDGSGAPVTVTSNVVTLTVEYGPEGVAANPANNMIYVADPGSNQISVISSLSNTLVATITVGSLPWGIAVGPATVAYPQGLVYVTDYGSGNVSVIDAANNVVIANVTVGTGPEGIAVNPSLGLAYVADSGSNIVSVINTTTDMVIFYVPVGSTPQSVAIGPAPYTVFVTDYGSNTVSVIQPNLSPGGSLRSFGVTTVTVGSNPWGVAVNPSTKEVYVTNSGSGTVSVLNGATFATIATLTVGSIPKGITIDTATSMAYVANSGSNTVSVINTATNAVITPAIAIPLGSNPWGVALLASSNLAYVTNSGYNTVSVINLVTNQVIETIIVS